MLLKIDNIFLVKMERIHPKNILIKTVTGIEINSFVIEIFFPFTLDK